MLDPVRLVRENSCVPGHSAELVNVKCNITCVFIFSYDVCTILLIANHEMFLWPLRQEATKD